MALFSTPYPSTPMSLTPLSLMIQPLWSVNTNISCWSLPNIFTRSITISGICIISQNILVIFFIEFRLINLNPSCTFPLGPMYMTLKIPLWIPPLTGFQWLVRYDLYCSHKPYGTSKPPFPSTKGCLPWITSIRKLLSIQQFDNSLLINLLTTILPMETP